MKLKSLYYLILSVFIIIIIISCNPSGTEDTVGKIVLTSPANSSIIADTSPLLEWRNDSVAVQYQLICADNPELMSPKVDDNTISDNFYAFSGIDTELCDNNTTYYWRVRARDKDGTWAQWSNTWNFTIHIPEPTNPYPSHESTIYSAKPFFNWDDTPGAFFYQLQVNDVADFDGAIITDNDSLMESYYQLESILKTGTTYYWRVRIQNEDEIRGAWSDTWSFNVIDFAAGTEITETTGSVAFDLRGVKSGSYFVGPEASGANNVTLTRNYWMSETEVTYELWYEVKTWGDSHGYSFANEGREGHDGYDGAVPTTALNEPVTMVNWHDCIVWCNALSEKQGLPPVYTYDGEVIRDSSDSNADACDNAVFDYNARGYRLPTGVEWEIAARGGSTAVANATYGTAYSGSDTIDDVAWYAGNSGEDTHNVGMKTANELFIVDMSGNAFEFCWDWFGGEDYPSTPEDPVSEVTAQGRMLRGGGLYSDSDCTIFIRYGTNPVSGANYIGFRFVRNEL